MAFIVKEYSDTETVKDLFIEYSHIKGAESCFVSFDKELNDLDGYYSGGTILIGYEEDKPVACVAVRKIKMTKHVKENACLSGLNTEEKGTPE